MSLFCFTSHIGSKRNYNTSLTKPQEERENNVFANDPHNKIIVNPLFQNNHDDSEKDYYDFNFLINESDTLFTLALNYGNYDKEIIGSLTTKIAIIKESYYINIDVLSKVLAAMNISELYIFSIDDKLDKMEVIKRDNGSKISYAEMKQEQFITLLNSSVDFLGYNKHSLYILRNGNFLDIKNLFTKINGCQINMGRGGSQRAHVLCPLGLRLSSYLMAMYNFDYKKLAYLNTFDDLDKDRYLSHKDMRYSIHLKYAKYSKYSY